MKLARHKKYGLIAMAIIDGDPNHIIDYIWETSDSVAQLPRADVIIENLKLCPLDPGGMLCMKEPWVKFELDNYKFEIQFSKIDWVILKLQNARERIPGYRRTGLFHCNLICSNELQLRLIEKLKVLSNTDAAIHAKLDDSLMKMEMEKTMPIIFAEIPREKPNGT